MRTRTRHQAPIALTLVALLGTAACGASDDTDPEAAPRQPPAGSAPTQAPSEDPPAEGPTDDAAEGPDPSDVPEESDSAEPPEEATEDQSEDSGSDDGGADDPAGALPDTDDVLGAPAEAVAALESRITSAENSNPLSVAQVEGIEAAAREAGAADNNGTAWMVGLYPTDEVGIYQVTVYTPGLVELWEVPGDGSQATDAGDSGLDPADPSFTGWQVHAGDAARSAMDAVGGDFVHQIHVLEAASPVVVVVVETPGDHLVRVGVDGVTGEPLNAVAI